VPGRRWVPTLVLGLLAASLAASSAVADPTVSAKQAEAQQVLGQINQIDASLERAVEAYNSANVKLDAIKRDQAENLRELGIAKKNFRDAQRNLKRRLVELYVSPETNSSLDVILGATSLTDLVDRIDTANRVSSQDSRVVHEVIAFRAVVQKQKRQLKQAHAAQAKIVASRAAERGRIESQLAQRRKLLSSIKDQITSLQAAERRREAAAAAAARARLAAHPIIPTTSHQVVGIAASTPTGTTIAPPATHGGVVGIAMQYLGVPYVWGGASPSGFDCSGLVMFAFAQIGVSVPHSSYAQFGMGSPVSMSQLQPGDLVFFSGASHVGIYVGGGSFIHAPHTGDVVKISSMTGWYSSTFAGGRRL